MRHTLRPPLLCELIGTRRLELVVRTPTIVRIAIADAQWAFLRPLDRGHDGPRIHHIARLSAIGCMDSSNFPTCASFEVWALGQPNQVRVHPNKNRGRRVMSLKLRRITAVLAAALTLAAASIPTNAGAQG